MQTVEDARELVRRFVVRARRIAAHSMVQDWDRLTGLSKDGFLVRADIFTGTTRVASTLPPDEEVFESLVARLRPLILKDDALHYVEVFKALGRVLHDAQVLDSDLQQRVDLVRKEWRTLTDDRLRTQRYEIHLFDATGAPDGPPISDATLARAWLYNDLVHADPKERLRDALRVPLADRYLAAVRVYCRVTVLVVRTLTFVESLCDGGLLDLGSEVWEAPVVVGADELVQTAEAFVGPVGTTGPTSALGPSVLNEDWQRLTVSTMRRMERGNQVAVLLLDENGQTVGSYDAAVISRNLTAVPLRWNVLVADSIEFSFTANPTGDSIRMELTSWRRVGVTNRLLLAAFSFEAQMAAAAEVVFEVHGERVAQLTWNPTEEVLLQQRAWIELLTDLVAIENHLGQTLSPCNASFSAQQQIFVRIIRLLYDGEVAPFQRSPLPLPDSPSNPAAGVGQKQVDYQLGECIIPVPRHVIYHPNAVVRDVAVRTGEAGGPFDYAAPAGERLLIWSPDWRDRPLPDPARPTADWDIPGIDRATSSW
jgi:hypothetical protein